MPKPPPRTLKPPPRTPKTATSAAYFAPRYLERSRYRQQAPENSFLSIIPPFPAISALLFRPIASNMDNSACFTANCPYSAPAVSHFAAVIPLIGAFREIYGQMAESIGYLSIKWRPFKDSSASKPHFCPYSEDSATEKQDRTLDPSKTGSPCGAAGLRRNKTGPPLRGIRSAQE